MNWRVKGLATAGVYVDDFEKALEFYRTELGFEKKSDMGEKGCWGKIGDLGLFIVQGDEVQSFPGRSECKTTFVLDISTGFDLFFRRMGTTST